ncbi:MAG: fatty acyl-AMP ligase [Leptolyngbya sp. SIOISBB]|nr:fatty acyl-AMP ligase [Leptolyngbya sp. SIOISBB]
MIDQSLLEHCSTAVDVLKFRAQQQPKDKAYTFLRGGEIEEASLTYGELFEQVQAIAALLQQKLHPGDKVLLAYQPGLDFVLAYLGCLCAQVIAVPAYPPRRNQNTARLRSIVQDSGITTALTVGDLVQFLNVFCDQDALLSKLDWVPTDQISAELAKDWQKLPISADDTAFLQYTSGSTGNPKGVIVSHGNLLHNSYAVHHCFGHRQDSCGVIWLPPYHDMGLLGGVLQPLYGGFPVFLMSPLDFLQKPLRWLHAISRYQATTSGGPNFAYDLLIKRADPKKLEGLDLSHWEVAFTGAEPIRAETLERFVETFSAYGFREEAFFPCYGMAESTLMISGVAKQDKPMFCYVDSESLEKGNVQVVASSHSGAKAFVSCGQSIPDQIIKIVDSEKLTICDDREVGEIWVSGPSVAQGYLDRPDESQASFSAQLVGHEEQAFLRTGDLGFLHNDHLYITGRIKDLIIIRGQNHYPQDIELTVERSHPVLRPNCGAAFSIDVKGKEQLVVVYEVERSALRGIDSDGVLEQMRQAITAQHALNLYAAVLVKTGSIPKTSSGKIRRRACRDSFLNGTLNIVKDWSQSPEHLLTFKSLQADVDSVLQKFLNKTEPGKSDSTEP